MSLELTIASVVCLLFGLGGLLLLPKNWRNEWPYRPDPDRPPPQWLFGDVLWRGIVRATPTLAPPMFICGGGALLLAGEREHGGALESLFTVCIVVCSASVLVLGPAVMLFNRPRCVVVPWMRDQPGALAEWFGGKKPKPLPAPKRKGRTVATTPSDAELPNDEHDAWADQA